MSRTIERERRKEQVRKMYSKKIAEVDIAKKMNLSLSTVRSYITEMGLKRKNWEAIRRKSVEMYLAGTELREIAKELDVSKAYISALIRKSGVPVRRRFYVVEENLINENTVFADNRVELTKIVIDGTVWQDVTPLWLPR